MIDRDLGSGSVSNSKSPMDANAMGSSISMEAELAKDPASFQLKVKSARASIDWQRVKSRSVR